MSSNALRPSAMCESCHQRPRHGGHQYCSKTCATQVASMCSQCHQKPKFGNFEYCGKHCASQAQKAGKPQPQAQVPAAIVPQARPANTVSAPAPATKGSSQPKKQQRSGNASVPQVTFQPQQVQAQVPPPPPPKPIRSWVKNAAAQIPAILSNSTNSNANQKANPQTSQPTTLSHKSLPQLNVPAAVPVPAADPASPAVCALPGCDEYAYVNPDGRQTSEYCSRSHREEAVESGLVSPCIMCLTLPQGNVDHFCGRACREEALSKSFSN